MDLFTGVEDSRKAQISTGRAWEGPPQSVRAAYRKEKGAGLYPEYRRARETRWETGGTTLQAKILPDDR